jgi:hypothetical protein
MPPRLSDRELCSPRPRVREDRDGYFFPNEVARLLGLEGLDYRQLRRLFLLVTRSRGQVPPRRWARFDFRDVAALRAAVSALGGVDVIRRSRRLRLAPLEFACEVLRREFDLSSPLTQARLLQVGRDVLVQLDGARFAPDSGQLLLDLPNLVGSHLELAGTSRRELGTIRSRLHKEEARVRGDGTSVVRDALTSNGLACMRLTYRRREASAS